MLKKFPFSCSLSLVLAINAGLLAAPAFATKLNAEPLPHDKDFSQAQETTIPANGSFLHRRPDYRDVEKQKAKDADLADKKAAQDRQQAQAMTVQAQQAQLQEIKKLQQLAIDANNKGVMLGKAGRWDEAIRAHELAVQNDPRNKEFRINLSAARTAYGQQRLAQKDYLGAASLFRKALSAASDNGLAGKMLAVAIKENGMDPNSADIRIMLGDQLSSANDFEGASVEYQAALQLENSGRTLVKMGDMAYRYGQTALAANYYRQAIVKDPEFGPAQRQLGFLAMAQKDYTAAAASLRKAIVLDSKDVAAGEALVEIWRKQVAINPLLAENHLGLAGALQLTGDFAGAESEYSRVEALDRSNAQLAAGRASLQKAYQHAKAEKHRLAATTLFNQSLRREALAEITQAVIAEPRNANYQFLLGECLESVGNYDGAHQAYLTCVLIDPENNKEAAVRIKQMQMNLQSGGGLAQNTLQPLNNVGAGNAANLGFWKKNSVEGQGSNHADDPDAASKIASMGFRTHDDAATDNAEPAPKTEAVAANTGADAFSKPVSQSNPNMNEVLGRVSDAETQHEFGNAVELLRPLVNNDLQNADLHHRLAANLLSAGQVSEAVSEFRIASALSRTNKSYSDDLAKALVINKRTLMSAADSATDSGASK